MTILDFNSKSIEVIFDKFKKISKVFEVCTPSHFGNFNTDDIDLKSEIAALLYSADLADEDFTVVSLGAAPGEWPLKAEQAYRAVRPNGAFKGISLEGDLHHFNITNSFLEQNYAVKQNHDVRYEVIASKDGFAYFPIVNPGVDWGAGVAAVSENESDLDNNITMSEVAKADRIGANGGAPLQFRTVKAVSLNTLINEIGVIDFLHCDIQGAEQDIFPPQMNVMNEFVRFACIGTHGREIEADLLSCFAESGWLLECRFDCDSRIENEVERIYRDGVYVWSNPRLT